jgi:hypothetical protein
MAVHPQLIIPAPSPIRCNPAMVKKVAYWSVVLSAVIFCALLLLLTSEAYNFIPGGIPKPLPGR